MVEKPIIGKRTGIGQAFDEMMKDLPITSWMLQQEQRRKKMKL